MKKIIYALFVIVGSTLAAQTFPVLELGSVEKRAEIEKLNISIDITSNIAITTVDMTFYNPNDRVMEGILKFPLTSNQSVVEFYLDINGKLRRASVVEKRKARVAYEGTIRRNIDPGVLEKSISNEFKARVFPIPAKGYKRAIFKIEERLIPDDNMYNYILPIESDQAIPDFSLEARIFSDERPKSHEDLSFVKWENRYFLDFKKNNYLISSPIKFKIPKGKESLWFNGPIFYLNIDVSELFNIKETKIAPKPRELTILWDVSGSAKNRDLELEYEYLVDFLRQESFKTEVKVIAFNVNKYPLVTFRANEYNKIVKYLKSIPLDGGTSFSTLQIDKIDTDRILLFSDGVGTMDRDFYFDSFNTPIDTIMSTFTVNSSHVKALSIKSGGNMIHLLEDIKQKNRPKLIDTELDGITDLNTALEITSNSFPITGRLNNKKGTIKLTFQKSSGEEVVKVLEIQADKERSSLNIERMWASMKIDVLNLNYKKEREKILSLGREFGIVTKETSLIVLDRVEDYVLHNIEPPLELIDRWNELKTTNDNRRSKIEKENLSEALNEMTLLKSWWNKEFPRDRPPVPKKELAPILRSESMSRFGIAESEEIEYDLEESAPGLNSEKKAKDDSSDKGKSIFIEGWNPEADYFTRLKDLEGDELLVEYHKLRKRYINRPSFFVDVATLFYEKGDRDRAYLTISNVLELDIEDPELLRITMYLLEKFGYFDEALTISLKLLHIRPEEPQTYRDIASLHMLNGNFQDSLDYYYRVLIGSWDSRFIGVKSVVLNEMNYLIASYKNSLDLTGVDPRLIFNMPLGIRSVISWSSDNNDIDLWVIDPYDEKCFYSNKLTHTGGKLSSDFTGGYGPEEFTIKKPLYGLYETHINYFSDNRLSVAGPVTIKVDLYKNYGKNMEKVTIIRRLSDVKESIKIGDIEF